VAEFEDHYGFFDKLLHRLAFKSSKLQLTLAENESDENRSSLDKLKVERPVFIASLPRSGTTILLDVLSKTQQFSYHRYQDMPFVFTPLMWAKFSANFAKGDALRERAHQDGIKINQQSPEAFEEMFYKAFWPALYQGNNIELWPELTNDKFNTFFIEHLKKLQIRDNKPRYLSKNNLNISRIPYIKKLFVDAQIVVPFREPLQHALSLLKQHQNFTQLHQSNRFAKQYMAGIGHFDFGANLKPVNFNGWFDKTNDSPDSLDFWLTYWIECYGYLLATQHQNVLFVSFEQLCHHPQLSLAALAQPLQIEPLLLTDTAAKIKVAKTHSVDLAGMNASNLAKAQVLYEQLSDMAINHKSGKTTKVVR
jgi:hypothetical protein